MQLTTLTDDNVFNSKTLLAEHGLCFYIEDNGKKILFDTGYSDIFIKNALSMGINLLDLDYIILSHGHYDHTGGLSHYLGFCLSAIKQGQLIKKPIIVAHPDVFLEKFEEGYGEIGCSITEEKLRQNFDLKLTKEPFNLTDNLVFLGEIPRLNDFEAKESIEKVKINGKYEDDYVIEDSALVYKSKKGLTVITGCSHSGICNIVDYAIKLCGQENVYSIIGGFHLIETKSKILAKTLEHLQKLDIPELYPCHCIDRNAKIEFAKTLKTNEIGVGFKLSY
jgi:7,8-dihydropterin-6-yl-methyl-4-(beta-D-ribofuranosyl)aminobenzene 5'-phosphate synthase